MGRWQRTHETVQQAALELFAEKGYDATTVAQIARRARVSEMTLFRHFATKEALLLSDPYDPLIAEAVRTRPPVETPMRAVVEAFRAATAGLGAGVGPELRERLRIVTEAQTLVGALERSSGATSAAVADALVDRGVEREAARVVASAVIAGLSTALVEWARGDDGGLREALMQALDVLGGGSRVALH